MSELDRLWDEMFVARHSKDGNRVRAIRAAIEAQSRAALLAELRAAVEGLDKRHIEPQMFSPGRGFFKGDEGEWVPRAAVLGLLSGTDKPVPEPLPQGDGLDELRGLGYSDEEIATGKLTRFRP